MARIKKRYIFSGVFLVIIFLILFFLSAITKNWLVKNSEKLIGRKLEIGELHFNYAKVAVQVENLALYEDNKTDKFLSFNELYVDFDPWNLLSDEYSFSKIKLVNPVVQVIQDGEKFNFDSLIPKEDSAAVKDTTQAKPLKFTIRNISLIDGKLEYNDLLKKNQMEMKNLNLNLPLIAWNNDQSEMGVDFQMGEKGHVTIQAVVDNLKKKYQINLTTENVDLHPATNYLTDYFDIQSLNGFLSSNLKIIGDMNEVINISLNGNGSISDFSALDGQSENILSSPKLSVSIKDINLKTFHFGFGKIEINEPHVLFVRNKEMTNFERFLQPYFRSDTASSVTVSSSPEKSSVTYSIDTLKISNGFISIADHTLNRAFSYELNDLNMTMAGLTESADRIPVEFSTKLNGRGILSGKTIWSMTDPMNLEMDAKIKRMELLSFSPYSEYYIASPITQGWLTYDLGLKMSKTSLSNGNKVKVDELEFGKRTKDTTAMKVPVRLGLYLMKDANDVIKFDIPVSGNPSEPKFKLGKIIWKTFLGLMAKTAASPFKALSSLAGSNPEALEKLPFAFGQDSLTQSQRGILTKLATISKKKPKLILEFTQSTDPEKEKSTIAVRFAKSDFVGTLASDSIGSKANVESLKDNDPNLLEFVRKTVPEVDSLGLETACSRLIDKGRVDARYQEILQERNRLVNDFLTKDQGIPTESVQVETADLKNLPQELRIPQFKIEVSVK